MDSRILKLVLCLPALLATAAQASSPLTGRWEAYTWEGIFPDESRTCQIATIRYRYYDIVPDAQGLRGTFFSVLYHFIFKAPGPCTIQGKTMRPMEMTVRSWGLSGYGSATPMRFSAKAAPCQGLYCPLLTTKDFTASVQRSGRGTEEIDEDDPTWKQRYDPPEVAAAELPGVRAAVERIRATFATGDPEQVAPLLSATGAAMQRQAFLRSIPGLKEQFALVEGVEPIRTYVMQPPENNKDPRVTAVAYMAAGLRRVDGTRAPVSFVLTKENGRWMFAGSN